MSEKDFIMLANVFRSIRPTKSTPDDVVLFAERTRQWYVDIEAVADFCQQQNPAFKRQRWFAYIAGECDPSGGSIKPRKDGLSERSPY